GLAQREVTDINHLLDFALGFRDGLAGLNLDEQTQVMLVFRQQLSPALDHISAAWCWYFPPGFEGFIGQGNHLCCLFLGGAFNSKEVFAGHGRAGLQAAAAEFPDVAACLQGVFDGGEKFIMSLDSHGNRFLSTVWLVLKCWCGVDSDS